MVAQLSFRHVLITTNQTRQALQELVYSRIAAAWTAKNPKYPVLFASEAILAITRGLYDAWKAGELSGDELAEQLSRLFNQDWAALAESEVLTREGPQVELVGLRKTRRIA
jgi:hypothetical protein